jgi:hypothetical protein
MGYPQKQQRLTKMREQRIAEMGKSRRNSYRPKRG